MEEDHRPWGYYRILADAPDHKVKRIVIYPGKRFSLQRHKKRDEHWYIIAGTALVTLNDSEINVQEGESVNIKRGMLHRVMNQGSTDLVFIEVQTGEYFGEDDIERIEDDFGRT
jgi:mannose-6-phosphate isomerase-like protein (cupin superfamily)